MALILRSIVRRWDHTYVQIHLLECLPPELAF